jgi:hypothetical protein
MTAKILVPRTPIGKKLIIDFNSGLIVSSRLISSMTQSYLFEPAIKNIKVINPRIAIPVAKE